MSEDPTRATARQGRPRHGNIGPADPHADPATDPALRPVRPTGSDEDRPTVAARRPEWSDEHADDGRDADRDGRGTDGRGAAGHGTDGRDADGRYGDYRDYLGPDDDPEAHTAEYENDRFGCDAHRGADRDAHRGADRGEDDGTGPTVALPRPDGAPRSGLRPRELDHSRTGGVWTGLIASAVVLVFLLVFVLQNQQQVVLSFLGVTGSLPLGVAMLLAAVAGLLLVAIPGGLRIRQLRRALQRPRR